MNEQTINLVNANKQFKGYVFFCPIHTYLNIIENRKLDYCNALLYGLPKYQLQRLQYVKNAAARVVLQMSRFQHITPVLFELHRLPIQYRIIFKVI